MDYHCRTKYILYKWQTDKHQQRDASLVLLSPQWSEMQNWLIIIVCEGFELNSIYVYGEKQQFATQQLSEFVAVSEYSSIEGW